jgi:hypothetical protein
MLTESKTLSLLQVVVPGDTALSVASEVKILELLGIIANPESVKAMNLALNLVPANTPATIHGLVQLLTGLAKQHPKFSTKHHDSVSKLLKSLDTVPDAVLTFGTFLPICDTLLKASKKKHTD